MKVCLKIALSFAALAAGLLTSCSHDYDAVAQTIHHHPVHETRMSDKPGPGYVATGVWRVRGRSGNSVYLVGTCHRIPANQIPFPSTYYAAYQDSQEIFMEIDDNAFVTPLMIFNGVPGMIRFFYAHRDDFFIVDEGRRLSHQLSPSTVKKLQAYYKDDYVHQERNSPAGLIVQHEMTGDSLPDDSSVDDVFRFLAKRDDKKFRALDSLFVAEAVGPVLEYSLAEARRTVAEVGADAAIESAILSGRAEDSGWRYGTFDADDRKELADMRKNAPRLYEDLLPRRNQRWMPSIRRALEGKHNVTVAVGALHLQGQDGLIEILRREGYKPEQMYGIDRPKVTPATR